MDYNLAGMSYAWEVKLVDLQAAKKPSERVLYFNNKTFQKEINNLRIFRRNGMIYKFPDIAGFGTPFDGITVKNKERRYAFVFIQFWKPREKKFYSISIEMICNFIERGEVCISEDLLLSEQAEAPEEIKTFYL